MSLLPEHCREAREASAAWNLTKTLFQTSLFWMILLIGVPIVIAQISTSYLGVPSFASPLWRLAGVVLFLTLAPLNLWTGVILATIGKGTPLPLDCPRALVVKGPYRHVRNPMAVSGLGLGAAVGLYLGAPLIIAYVIFGGLLWNYTARPWEERDLERRFGEEFVRYRREVGCWIPRLRPYRG